MISLLRFMLVANQFIYHKSDLYTKHYNIPVSTYHYSENAIANLLSFAKLADDYYIICNTRIDNAIYMQSKDDGKYLRFQRDHKFDLY